MNKESRSALRWLFQISYRSKRYILILSLVQSLLGISGIFYALILRRLIDSAVDGKRRGFFLAVLLLVGLVVLQILLRTLDRFLEEYTKATLENNLKNRLFSCLLWKDYAQVSAIHSGEWMNRLTSDTVVTSEGMATIVPKAIGMLVKLVGAVSMILVLQPLLGLVMLPGGLLLALLTYFFRKVLKRHHKKVQEADGKLRVYLHERLGSMLVVRAFAKEGSTLAEARELMEEHKKARLQRNRFSNLCNAGFGGAMQGVYVLGAAFCGYGILNGTMTFGTLTAVLQLIGQVQAPFANITGFFPKYCAMLASAERLMDAEALSEGGSARRESHGKMENHENMENRKSMEEIQEYYRSSFLALNFKDISFSYGQTQVLSHLQVCIRKGEYVAFTGHSGCGKSTLLYLLLCLYVPDDGTIFLEQKKDKDIQGTEQIPLDMAYQQLFSYVPQGNHLMSGSIREVVAFSKDEKDMANDSRIWEALETACAADFIRQLPSGLDTLLGERGQGLSEGQMQRIAIARAIYTDRPILILDEATSALDQKTEEQLIQNLRNMTDKTVLMVVHRMAVLSICDKEIRFTEKGTQMIESKKEDIQHDSYRKSI